jgi:hypothetical protein
MGSEWRDAIPPASLFPSATSIRLSGQTTREIAAGILAESSKRLENLGLNNLIQFSEMEPPLPTFTIADDFHEYWEVHGGRKHKTIPGTRLMAGITDTLLEHCPVLTSLCITTGGEGEHYFRVNPWNDSRCSSWASFLASVRDQLCYLSFKQGRDRNHEAIRSSPRRSLAPDTIYRNFDEYFKKWILPVLIEAPWSRMERMEIKGVGHSPNITNEASSFLSLNTKNSPGDIQHKFGLTRSAFPTLHKNCFVDYCLSELSL